MRRAFLLSAFLCCVTVSLFAQADITVVASGLRAPVGIDPDHTGNYLVAQSGTGQNDGEVTLMTPEGALTSIVVGLPSVFDTVTNEIVGTFRAQMIDYPYFAVFNAVGTEESGGPVVLLYDMLDFVEGEPFTVSDAIDVLEVGRFVLGSGIAESNPYSMVHDGCDWYIADAAANAIIRRDGLTGQFSVFAEFPSFPNPLPFGPPFIHPVPTRIITDPEGGFLVSGLTGFPFIDGAANIWHVSEGGDVTVHDAGYTLLTDLDLHRTEGGFISLQFADFDLTQAPPFVFGSSILVHTMPGGARDTLAEGFGPSPGMAVADDGIVYVTELFTGNVLRIDTETVGIWDPQDDDKSKLTFAPNPANTSVDISYTVPENDNIQLKVFDLSGKMINSFNLGLKSSGLHKDNFALHQIDPSGLTSQSYYIKIEGSKGWSFDNVLIVTR